MLYEQIDETAQTAARYVNAYFQGHDHAQTPDQWLVALDDAHHVGLNINEYEGCIALTAWRRGMREASASHDLGSEALMRRTFDTRLDNGLVGCVSQALGLGVSVPVYAAYDSPTLGAAIERLLRDLDGMTFGTQQQAPATLLPLPETLHARPADHAETVLSTLAQACGHTALPEGARHFDLLFDDLPGRISLHPSNRLVVADFFLNDAATLSGALRRAVVRGALVINQAALHGHAFAIGLDSRNFVVGTGRITMERLTESFWPRWLHYQMSQALDSRSLIKSLSLEHAEIGYVGSGDDARVSKGARK